MRRSSCGALARVVYGEGVIRVDLVGVRVELPSSTPVVLLRERGGDRVVPIWIGATEAAAIAFATQGVEPPRPLTHDLLLDVVEALGRRVPSRESIVTERTRRPTTSCSTSSRPWGDGCAR